MSTKEKILQTALELFNAKGCENVTTNHIASSCGISPGNLYYHYKNKEEIIYEICLKMNSVMDELWNNEIPAEEMMANIAKSNFYLKKLQKEYRFFYLDINNLLVNNQALREGYLVNKTRRISQIKAAFSAMASIGYFNFASDEVLEQVVNSIWFVSEYWLLFANINAPGDLHNDTNQFLITNFLKAFTTDKGRLEVEKIEANWRSHA